jgi:hypothetical protein
MIANTVAISTLQDTIRRAIARFLRERARIERAATLVALGHVSQVLADIFEVRSQTTDGLTYAVSTGSYADKASGCGCVDAQRHPGQSCKHAWAVDIALVAEERQRRLNARESAQAARAAVTADAVALAYAKAIGFGRAA